MVEVIYTVIARRSDDGWWALSCPDVRGAHSQVRRVVEARDRALASARTAAERARTAQVEAAAALVNDGLTLRDAGIVLGLSHQRVEQLLRERETVTR